MQNIKFKRIILLVIIFIYISLSFISTDVMADKLDYKSVNNIQLEYEKKEDLRKSEQKKIKKEIPKKEDINSKKIKIVYKRTSGFLLEYEKTEDMLMLILALMLTIISILLVIKLNDKKVLFIAIIIFFIIDIVLAVNFAYNFQDLRRYNREWKSSNFKVIEINKFEYYGFE